MYQKRKEMGQSVRTTGGRNKYQGVNMRCYRCGGVMIYQKFYGDWEYFFGWKCVPCGEIVDRVVLENGRSSVALDPRAHRGAPLREKE